MVGRLPRRAFEQLMDRGVAGIVRRGAVPSHQHLLVFSIRHQRQGAHRQRRLVERGVEQREEPSGPTLDGFTEEEIGPVFPDHLDRSRRP